MMRNTLTEFDLFNQPPLTLYEARELVRNKSKKGIICPCCGQFSKVYNRKLNSGMAITLIRLFKETNRTSDEWVHVKDFLRVNALHNNHDWTLLRYWGLIEPHKDNDSTDKQKHSGLWAITEKGKEFVKNTEVKLPKRIILYANEFKGFDGEPISIVDALGDKFNYWELMNQLVP